MNQFYFYPKSIAESGMSGQGLLSAAMLLGVTGKGDYFIGSSSMLISYYVDECNCKPSRSLTNCINDGIHELEDNGFIQISKAANKTYRIEFNPEMYIQNDRFFKGETSSISKLLLNCKPILACDIFKTFTYITSMFHLFDARIQPPLPFAKPTVSNISREIGKSRTTVTRYIQIIDEIFELTVFDLLYFSYNGLLYQRSLLFCKKEDAERFPALYKKHLLYRDQSLSPEYVNIRERKKEEAMNLSAAKSRKTAKPNPERESSEILLSSQSINICNHEKTAAKKQNNFKEPIDDFPPYDKDCPPDLNDNILDPYFDQEFFPVNEYDQPELEPPYDIFDIDIDAYEEMMYYEFLNRDDTCILSEQNSDPEENQFTYNDQLNEYSSIVTH